jgi:hypothetical protein
MARTRHELDAQPFEVVIRVGERVDLQFAAVARTGIDQPDGQRLAEDVQDLPADALDVRPRSVIARERRRLRRDPGPHDLSEDLPHQRSCPE